MIEARDLSFTVSEQVVSTQVLHHLHFKIEKGEYVAIQGPSGSGKTTLLTILSLLQRPTAGQLWFMGQEVALYSDSKLDALRRGNVSYLSKQADLLQDFTVYENLELPLIYQNYSRTDRRQRIQKAAEIFQIQFLFKLLPSQLTLLQQQLVALTRSAVGNPQWIVADEPMSRLNSKDALQLIDALSLVSEQGIGLIVGTDSEWIADRAERTIRLFDGHILL